MVLLLGAGGVIGVYWVCQVKCVSSKIFLIGDHILVANLAYKIKCFTF